MLSVTAASTIPAIDSPEVLIPAAAGLLGALIGGGASLLATRSANKHAIRMLRLQRREEAADDALGVLWAVIINNQPDDLPAGEIVDIKAIITRTFDLANRSAGDEPHLRELCHDYALRATAETPWKEFRLEAGALSGAITEWRTDPRAFRRNKTFDEYLSRLAAERAEIEATESTPPS